MNLPVRIVLVGTWIVATAAYQIVWLRILRPARLYHGYSGIEPTAGGTHLLESYYRPDVAIWVERARILYLIASFAFPCACFALFA